MCRSRETRPGLDPGQEPLRPHTLRGSMQATLRGWAEATRGLLAPASPKKPASDPEMDAEVERPRKPTLGMDLRASYRAVVISSFIAVLVITMTVQVTSQVILANDIAVTLTDACTQSTQGFVNSTASLILELGQLGVRANLNSSVYLLSSAMAHNEASMTTALNYLKTVPPVPTGIPWGVVAFLQWQMLTDYYLFSDWIMLAPLLPSPGYLDVSSCTYKTYCNRTVAVSNGNGTLFRCPYATPVDGNSSTIPKYKISVPPCAAYQDFNISLQPPVVDQVARAGLPAGIVWSSVPFVIQGAQYLIGAPPVLAIASSWPYLGGAVYAPLTSVSIAAIMSEALVAFIYTYASLLPAATTPFSLANDTCVFATDLNGYLLGGSWGVAPNIVAPTSLQLAVESSVVSISDSARYVLYKFGSFNSSKLRDIYIGVYIELPNGTFGECPLNLVSRSVNCTMIGLQMGSSPVNLGGDSFPTAVPGSFLVAVSIDLSVFLAPFTEELLNASAASKVIQKQSSDRVDQLTIVGVGIAIAAVILGLIVAYGLSLIVTHPLERLTKAMARLRQFHFTETKKKRYQSRITDIAAIEKGFLALSSSIETFSKFVPASVVKEIVLGKHRGLHVDRRIVTILFSDIRGFTSISEKLSPTDLLYLLTRYLTAMTQLVESFDGVVSEILGDGLLCFFGAPDECIDHASKACACALAMQASVKELSAEFSAMLDGPLEVRVGINTGSVFAGNLGSPMKLKYGCLGDAVNTASRLEGLCKLYGVSVLISDSTNAELKPGFVVRKLDYVILKGREAPTWVYEVVELETAITTTRGQRVGASEENSNGDQDDSLDLTRFLPVPSGFRTRIPRKPNNAAAAAALTAKSTATLGPIAPFNSEDALHAHLACASCQQAAWEHFEQGRLDEARVALKEWHSDPGCAMLLARIERVASGAFTLTEALQPSKLENKDF